MAVVADVSVVEDEAEDAEVACTREASLAAAILAAAIRATLARTGKGTYCGKQATKNRKKTYFNINIKQLLGNGNSSCGRQRTNSNSSHLDQLRLQSTISKTAKMANANISRGQNDVMLDFNVRKRPLAIISVASHSIGKRSFYGDMGNAMIVHASTPLVIVTYVRVDMYARSIRANNYRRRHFMLVRHTICKPRTSKNRNNATPSNFSVKLGKDFLKIPQQR